MAVTSEDVAQLAGVSRATVSYVVNNGPRPVAHETRQRVLQAIQKLGYQPNAVARNLRMQRSSTLGLIVPDTHNPYFSEVARGIERIAFERGYTVFLCHSGSDLASEIKYIDMLHAQRVAGIIWIPGTADFTPYQRLSGYGINTVIIDRLVPNDKVPAVTADNLRGGILATEHLIDLGHRRIGYISRPVDLSHSKGRFQGYQDALQQAGIAFDPDLVVKGGFVLEDGRQAVNHLLALPEPPTAVFAYNDIMAIGALRALHENGLRVPDDFSLVGFDDIAQASFTCPSLTTVYLPKYEMGQRGAELLIALIEKKKPDARVLRPLDVELVVRESTGPVKNQIEHRSTH
jgi:DNA-binding LacI/PurR family transcriptional regulator